MYQQKLILNYLAKEIRLQKQIKNIFKQFSEELWITLAGNLQGALPVIAQAGYPALTTTNMDDIESLLCFARQMNGYSNWNDVCTVAKAKGMKVMN